MKYQSQQILPTDRQLRPPISASGALSVGEELAEDVEGVEAVLRHTQLPPQLTPPPLHPLRPTNLQKTLPLPSLHKPPLIRKIKEDVFALAIAFIYGLSLSLFVTDNPGCFLTLYSRSSRLSPAIALLSVLLLSLKLQIHITAVVYTLLSLGTVLSAMTIGPFNLPSDTELNSQSVERCPT